jgi:hypothetical protein
MDPIIPALILSKAIELGVTEYGIKNRAFREGNPLIQDQPTRIILNSAFMIGSPLIYKEIRRTHPRQAKIVGIALIVVNGYLVYHNVKLMKR